MLRAQTYALAGHKRHVLLALAASCFAVGLVACGSSGNHGANGPIRYGQALKFSDCMRAHGVTNFPDPSTGGGGIHISIAAGSGINPQSPAFESAQSACSKLLPGGGPSSGHPSEQDRLQMLNLARCMRGHGILNFPDPTSTPPTPGNGISAVIGRNGVFLALPPGINPQSPSFQRAASACGFPIPGT